MSIATFESPRVATQKFFPWVLDDEAGYSFSETDSAQNSEAEDEVVCQPVNATLARSEPADLRSVQASVGAAETRLAMPVRLGAVMLKLLKSYGITDEEIAEGMAAYAAKSGLAQAS